MQDNKMQGNPDGFETVWKIGNNLEKSGQFLHHSENGKRSEKSGQLIRFFCYMPKKLSDEPKNFGLANATLLPRFLHFLGNITHI
jgi:hypothetical protein